MITIGQRIARAARATELADATNIGINDGRAAFQSVFHIHLHVLPRRNGDKLSLAKGHGAAPRPRPGGHRPDPARGAGRHRYRGLANFQSTRSAVYSALAR